MKLNVLPVAAAVFVVALSSRVNANEPLLSPRAKANQITTVSGVTEDKLDRDYHAGSPRIRASQTRVASGVTADKLDRASRAVSPRARVTWPHLAQSDAVADCKMMAAGKCTLPCKSNHTCSLPCCKT